MENELERVNGAPREGMSNAFLNQIIHAHTQCSSCPRREEVISFFDHLLGWLFPTYSSKALHNKDQILQALEEVSQGLVQLLISLRLANPERVVERFIDDLPSIYQSLQGDVEAMYNGDPAAKSKEEVIRSYPGFYSIAAYRVANRLLHLRVDALPRIITEHAHSRTGIDIHPGAKIGARFCIDHGTGVVIGETTLVGNDVKLYQGVTLGALSVNKKDASTKRHPTIEDGVVIYSGATILGGKTVVGHHSVIGGNVWLTESVPPYSKVYYMSDKQYRQPYKPAK